MTMADILQVLLLIVGALIIVVSYWLLFEALAPRWVERSRKQYVEHPFRAVFAGIFLLALPLIAAIALIQSPAQAIGFFIIFGLILIGLLGSAGLARHVGTQLPSEGDEKHPWRRVLRGGAVLSISCVMPFLGWFAVLPLILVSGFGALALSIISGRKKPASGTDQPAMAQISK